MTKAEAQLEAEGQSPARMLKDLFAGAAGGIAQVLIGKDVFLVLSVFSHSCSYVAL